MNVISSNIRFDNPQDGRHCWQGRRRVLARKIIDFAPHLLATQEGRRPQLQDLASLIPLELVDSHRDWIPERMYPSLFIHPELSALESGDIWLSETPHVPGSKSFGSAFPRLATWARVRSRRQTLLVANLHLDHQRPDTRLEQIKVFTTAIREILRQDWPLLLFGDFNEGPQGPVYQWVLKELSLSDPWAHLGHPEQSSYHRFDGSTQNGERIDWILSSHHFQAECIFFDTQSDNGIFPSDHFPLLLSVR